MPIQDVKNSHDVKVLVDTFYEKVLKDDMIGYIFTDIAQIDLPAHMPIMYSFWETVLLDTLEYKGNPMTKHIILHEKEPLKDGYFDRWLNLWEETVNELFAGEKAELAISRAKSVAALMKYKVNSPF